MRARMQERAPRLAWLWVTVLASLPLAGAFLAVSLASSPLTYSARDLATLVAVYFLLSVALSCQAAFVAAGPAVLSWISGLPAALILTWFIRETLRVLDGGVAVAAVCATVCLVVSWIARRQARYVAARHSFVLAGASTLALIGLLVPAVHSWNDFRVHVLKHNRVLGMPLYYAQFPRVTEVVKERWAERGKGPVIKAPQFTQGPSQGPSPNIVFVLADTLRADRLAAYGGPPEIMPNANAFAARSAVVSDVVSNASWTRPSVGSIFTGLPQEQHGAIDRDDALPPTVDTMAESLSARGYHTAAFVTNYGAVGVAAGFSQGFSEFYELEWPAHGPNGSAYMPAELVNERVRDWLKKPRPEQPLFLYVHYLDPHEPLTRPAPKSRSFGEQKEAYNGNVHTFDGHLPELFDDVRASLGPTTIIVLTADHGEEFGEHGAAGHGSALSYEQIKIPLIISVPGQAPSRLAARLEGRDMFGLVGFLANGGTDLAQWAKRASRATRYSSVFLTTPASWLQPHLSLVGMQAYEDGKHLVRWSAYGETYELYDLAKDPDLRRNMFEDRQAAARPMLPSLLLPIRSAVEASHPAALDSRAQNALRALGYVQ